MDGRAAVDRARDPETGLFGIAPDFAMRPRLGLPRTALISVSGLAGLRLRPLQLPHRLENPLPHGVADQVALLEHGIRPHGGLERRVLAVALHEHVGGANVEGQ